MALNGQAHLAPNLPRRFDSGPSSVDQSPRRVLKSLLIVSAIVAHPLTGKDMNSILEIFNFVFGPV